MDHMTNRCQLPQSTSRPAQCRTLAASGRKDGDSMTRSEAARKAGLARAAQFTSVSQRHARRYLTSEQAAANGRRGAQATISRYGPAFLFEKCRQYRLANPSRLELQMIGILSRMGINCSREHRIGASLFTLDFYLP